jgi:hypothetical protein
LLAALLALTSLESHVGLPEVVPEYQGHPGNSAVIAGFLFLETNYSEGNQVSRVGDHRPIISELSVTTKIFIFGELVCFTTCSGNLAIFRCYCV